ncbi:redoxin domain-containing protein [Bacillus sp. FJAT-27251]|uniref:redoxin domain-containing protein n=1 Tax=Bacillus sp. FJAT-27251 TaxID=1684142 RepID=UPI0006A79EC1|nr:redoxin domain-containing protein [Bacillus sp. FJAT-27251]
MVIKPLAISMFVGVLMLALFAAMDKGNQPETSSSPIVHAAETGKPAPSFSLVNMEGKEVKLEDYKGKKVMLNFWATWCPPCKAEMPAMQQLYEKAGGSFEILAIAIDPDNDVAGFVNEYELTFPILLDKNGTVNNDYGIISIPTTFLIDEDGKMKKKHIGMMTLEQMEEFMEP